MKKIMCVLLMFITMLSTVYGIAEESAIDKLSEFERSVYDALLIMLNDFKDPSSVRVMTLEHYQEKSYQREKYLAGEDWDGGPDTVIIQLTGNNSFGGKSNARFELCHYTWNEEPRTEMGKSFVEFYRSNASALSFHKNGGKNFLYLGTAGEYIDATDVKGYFSYEAETIGNINRALKAHWEILGF